VTHQSNDAFRGWKTVMRPCHLVNKFIFVLLS
jgi:hypothetical protein